MGIGPPDISRGAVFNAVVPGTVGGELAKADYVAKHTPKAAAVLVSAFVDASSAWVGLAVWAAAMLAIVLATGLETFQRVRLPVACVGVVLAAAVALLAFLFSGRFRRALRLERLYQRLPVAHQFVAAGDAVRLYRRRLGSMTGTVVLTFAAHAGFVGFVALTGLSLSLPTAWYNYFVYVPLIYIIGSVPLTPGGVGWIENWYVRFFQTAICVRQRDPGAGPAGPADPRAVGPAGGHGGRYRLEGPRCGLHAGRTGPAGASG